MKNSVVNRLHPTTTCQPVEQPHTLCIFTVLPNYLVEFLWSMATYSHLHPSLVMTDVQSLVENIRSRQRTDILVVLGEPPNLDSIKGSESLTTQSLRKAAKLE